MNRTALFHPALLDRNLYKAQKPKNTRSLKNTPESCATIYRNSLKYPDQNVNSFPIVFFYRTLFTLLEKDLPRMNQATGLRTSNLLNYNRLGVLRSGHISPVAGYATVLTLQAYLPCGITLRNLIATVISTMRQFPLILRIHTGVTPDAFCRVRLRELLRCIENLFLPIRTWGETRSFLQAE